MTGISSEARAVHDAALIVDLHCDLLLTSFFLGWDWKRRHAPNPLPGAPLMGHCDLPRLREGNVGCLGLGVVVNPLRGRSGPEAIRLDLDRMNREAAESPDALVVCGDAASIRAARAAGKISCFAGLEGAHALDARLDILPDLHARGLRYVTLAHFTDNAACPPMVGWGASATRGLTAYGHELVDALVELGVVVDLAHVGRAAFFEAAKRARRPVFVTHTACNAVYGSPRGLDDDQIRAVADTGGVVGVIFVTPFIGGGGVAQVVRHLEHLRKTVGVAHIAIGTDWEGFSLYPSDLASAEQLPALTEALLKNGWKPEEIHAAYGENTLRVIEAVCGR